MRCGSTRRRCWNEQGEPSPARRQSPLPRPRDSGNAEHRNCADKDRACGKNYRRYRCRDSPRPGFRQRGRNHHPAGAHSSRRGANVSRTISCSSVRSKFMGRLPTNDPGHGPQRLLRGILPHHRFNVRRNRNLHAIAPAFARRVLPTKPQGAPHVALDRRACAAECRSEAARRLLNTQATKRRIAPG